MDSLLKDGERIDSIGFGNLRLIQKSEDFCYGIDAVLLATFADINKSARVIDLGTGTGIIPLILSYRTQVSEIFGVEVQENSYERGLRNILLNDLKERITLIRCDVKDLLKEQSVKSGSFDAVLTNPPYVKYGGGLKNKTESRMIARHETTSELSDFIKEASLLLREKGDFYMVHRPNRLADIMVLCRLYDLEPKRIRFVSPNKDSAPNIILLHCVKYGRPDLKFLNPLYVYTVEGSYTDEINALYERP